MRPIRRWILLALFTMLVAGCSSLKVGSDYDPQYDFSIIHKIAIVYAPSEDGVVSLAQQRFAKALREALQSKGYEITGRDSADLLMLFHLNVTEKRQIVTDYELVGLYPYYPAYYGYYGGVVPVTREYTWNEAKIVIDAVDPHGNRVVWRGVATDRLKSFDTPQERMAYIRDVVTKILADFPPKNSFKGTK